MKSILVLALMCLASASPIHAQSLAEASALAAKNRATAAAAPGSVRVYDADDVAKAVADGAGGSMTASAPSTTSTTSTQTKVHPPGLYTNVDGKTKNGPSTSGIEKTIACGDGTGSESDHSRGACSGHGGVKRSKASHRSR
jgi:outer membrane receptor protein involved in Fe transport